MRAYLMSLRTVDRCDCVVVLRAAELRERDVERIGSDAKGIVGVVHTMRASMRCAIVCVVCVCAVCRVCDVHCVWCGAVQCAIVVC